MGWLGFLKILGASDRLVRVMELVIRIMSIEIWVASVRWPVGAGFFCIEDYVAH